MPRVLIVEQTAAGGGAAASVESLLGSGVDSEFEYVIAVGETGPLIGRASSLGFEVHVLEMQGWRWWNRSPKGLLKVLLTLPFQLVSVWRWSRLVRRVDPVLVHINNNRPIEPLLAAKFAGRPVVVHFRDIPSRMSMRFLAGSIVFYRLMNLADRWFANSAETAADIQPHARVPLTTIPNGLDLERFDREAGQGAAPPRPRRFRIAMIALLNSWKRHDLFLSVAERVLARYPDATFSIVGSGDPIVEQALREQSARGSLKGAIEFAGYIANIPAYLRGVDVLLHTADPEPFGRIFLEAMAGSTPVVAFDSGGPREIVEHGATGVLIPSGDLNQMAEAVIEILCNEERRLSMGAAGRSRAEQWFTAGEHRSAVFREYRAMLNERSSVAAIPS